LIYSGFYFSAISVSQDKALCQTIRKSVMEQSKLLDHIGSTQMERELQGLVLTLAEKASNIMGETGVEPPMTEVEMKNYMELVIREMKEAGKVEKGGGQNFMAFCRAILVCSIGVGACLYRMLSNFCCHNQTRL
jgi:hypothetical protein